MLLESRRVPTLYRVHERPERRRRERLIDQLESLGVPTPPVPGGHLTPQQAADVDRRGLAAAASSGSLPGEGRGRRGLTSLVLRSLKQAYYDHRNLGHCRPAVAALLPFHLADPPLPGPDLPPGTAVGGGGGRPGARRSVGRGRRTVGLGPRARGDDDRARRRRHRACFLLERLMSELGDDEVFEGEVVGLIGAGAFVVFGEQRCVRGHAAGAASARRLVGAQRAGHDPGRHAAAAARSGSAIRCGCGSGGSTRRGVGWTCFPAWEED